MIDGSRIAGLTSVLWIERQATASRDEDEAPHVRTSLFFIAAPAKPSVSTMSASAKPNPSASACAVPAGDDQAAHALDQVGDRVVGRDLAKPGDLDQVARQARGAQEQRHEQQREEALHRLAGAEAQRQQRAEAGEAEGDQDRQREQHERAAERRWRCRRRWRGRRAGRRPTARRRRRSRRRAGRRAAPLPRSGVSASRLKKPDSMSRARSVPARDRDEQRALDERHGEREVAVADRWEARDRASPR